MKTVLALIATGLSIAACNMPPPDSDQKVRQQQEMLNQEAVSQVGMPAISHFFEKRLMKDILEMRDNPKLATITYISDMNGKLHKRCDSIGYGLPYATQYTNPQRLASVYGIAGSNHYTDGALPQADPNGLFSPAAAEGTWVLCLNPVDKKLSPVYFEDRITVSTFPLPGAIAD